MCCVVRIKIEEANVLTVEVEFCHTYGTVTVLFNENLGDVWSLSFFVFVHLVFTVNKHYNVGVLLDRTRVTKVGEARSTTTLFYGTREL